MTQLIQRLGISFAAIFGLSMSALADAPAPCVLTGLNLHIEVRSEPDDGAWGPTIEIAIADDLQPLNRMIVPESRPIEACWWADIDADSDHDKDLGAPELIIGVGAADAQVGGAIVFDWDGRQLQRRSLPALPAGTAGTFRYVVSNGGLWAHPVTPNSESKTAGASYRLSAGHWAAIRGDAGRSRAR